MATDKQTNFCTSEFGAEVLMAITSVFVLYVYVWQFIIVTKNGNENHQRTNPFLSSTYAIFLPLMSYLFSLAKQDSDKGRAEVILIWMVLTEIIHICGDHNWELQKSAEQLARLVWVGFLVYNYTPLHGVRTSLLVLCIYFLIYEVLKGICFNKVKDSYLLGKNPKLIHSYMRSVMLENEPNTIPLSSCKYIVMGEENHKINVCDDGYHLGVSRSGSEILKIDRVFAFTASDTAFTSEFPYWRDTCLSLALAKMLRRRFANLPLDETGSRKALDFVLEGLIDYIGNNRDIIRDGSRSRSESNPKKRVFNIIKEELKLVSKFLHTKVPIDHHLPWYALVNAIGFFIVLYSGSYLSVDLGKALRKWRADALVVQDAYNNCFFNIFRSRSEVLLIFSKLDIVITYLLYAGCSYIQLIGFLQVSRTISWSVLYHVERHINATDRISNSSESSCLTKVLFLMASYADDYHTHEVTRARAQSLLTLFSVLDIKAESIVFHRIKVNVSILARLPKCIRRIIPIVIPDVDHYTNVEEAILSSFRHSGGRLTNGETSLRNNNMSDLNWACPPNGSTTEAILIWHIATTLFRIYYETSYLDNNTHQEPSDQQYTNQLLVALQLSSYCRYLVAYLPQLLPDEVEWTKEKYESVIEEMVSIDCPSGRTTATYRYNYVLRATWHEESVVGKGVMLAKDLMKHHEDGGQVWKMLANFWPELILFIAPSDNVKGHEEILEREELITQVWALLTHAGILTRPKCTGSTASNEVSGDENV